MCSAITDAGVSCWFMASSEVGSTPWAMTTLPSGAAQPAPGAARTTSAAAKAAQRPVQIMPASLDSGTVDATSRPTLGGVLRGVKRVVPHPPDIGQGRLSRCHGADSLGLAEETKQPADLGARRQLQGLHRFAAVQEQWCRQRGGLLAMARHELAHGAALRAAPHGQRRVAPQRRRIGEGEEQEIARVVPEVPEEAIAGATAHGARLGQMHGAQVMADEALEHARHPPRQAKPLRNRDDPLGAEDVVAEKARAPALDAPGLRLGDIVEQRRQLERFTPRGAVTERLAKMPGERLAPGLELAGAGCQEIGALDGAQAVLPDVEAVRLWLRRRLHRFGFGQDNLERAPAVEKAQAAGRGRAREDDEDLVPDPFGGYPRETGRRPK